MWPTNGKQYPSARQVVGQQGTVEQGILSGIGCIRIRSRRWAGIPAAAHCEGSVKPLTGTAFTSRQGALKRGIDDPELVILVQEGLLIHDAGLDVVNALRVADVRERAGVEKAALLGDAFPLQILRAKIVERVIAGVVVEGVAPHVARHVEDGIRTDACGSTWARCRR